MPEANLKRRINYLLWRVAKKIRYYFCKVYFSIFKPHVICNICGWGEFHFRSDEWHRNSICPKCDSQVRHRLFWAILNNHKKYNKEIIIREKKILHFAPERKLRYCIQELSKDYKTADFFAESYHYSGIDYNIDISDMKDIENEVFDCVIVFDVLEHVVDDRKALKELNRITKPGGIVILTVPMKDNLKITFEDPSITDPKQRELTFGQFDHLRIYGEDLFYRIAEQGFNVEVVDHTMFEEETIKRHVLFPPVLSDHPLATNYRKIYFGIKVKK